MHKCCSVLLDPVGEGVLAILDDGLGSLVAIVGVASLTWSDRGVVDELEELLLRLRPDWLNSRSLPPPLVFFLADLCELRE